MSPVAPISPGDRIAALDVVRGVALLGILLVNVHLFRRIPLSAILAGEDVAGRTAADRLVEVVTGTFFTGTFLGLFSLLFGIGIALQLSRVRGGRFGTTRLLTLQRMVWLLVIAIAHRQFSSVDILLAYSIVGIGIVMMAGPFLPPRVAWTRTLAGLGLFLVVALCPLAANLDGLGASGSLLRERPEFVQQALASGGLLERVEARALESLGSQRPFGFLLQILGWMLLGLWVGSSRLLWALRGRPAPLVSFGAGALVSGATLRMALALPVSDPGVLHGPDGLGGFLGVAGSVLLVIGVGVTTAGLSIRAAGGGRPYRRLSAVGRVALSAYILQSVLVELVFAIPGARGTIGSAGSLLVVLGVWGVLLVLCPWWLERFRFGPVEWLWRSLTYLKVQPLRTRPEPATAP